MSSKTSSERAKEWRAKQAAAKTAVSDARDELIELLRDQVADLRDQRDEAERRLKALSETFANVANDYRTLAERIANADRTQTERFANIAQELASIRAAFGGFGGSRSGSLSPLPASEKEREDREFQDLNGKTRARGRLSNGTVVPGRLGGDEEPNAVRIAFAMTPNAVANGTTEPAAVLDSPKTETRAKKALLGPPLLGELSEEEIERRRRSQLEALAKLEAGE